MKSVYEQSQSWRVAAVLLAVGLTLVAFGAVHGQHRGWWDSTAFQVVNLDAVPATITARFIDLAGATVYTLTDEIPALGTQFYQPEQMEPPLDPDFVGTLRVDSEQNVAATILHLDEEGSGPLQLMGNTPFEVVDQEQFGNTAMFPVDWCTILAIHNLAAEPATVAVTVFDEGGAPYLNVQYNLPPEGSHQIALGSELPPGFVGSAVVEATHPIQVTIIHACANEAGLGSFVAPTAGKTTWIAPWVLPNQGEDNALSLVAVQNTSDQPANVVLIGASGQPFQYTLPPRGSLRVPQPDNDGGPLLIQSDQPVTAEVLTFYNPPPGESQEPPGRYVYGALDPQQATTHVALPLLLRNFEGWTSDEGVYVQNVGTEATTVNLCYVTPDGNDLCQQAVVEPGQVWQPQPPDLPFQHAAAAAWADQPLIALVTAHKANTNDGWMAYRGVNYLPAGPNPPLPKACQVAPNPGELGGWARATLLIKDADGAADIRRADLRVVEGGPRGLNVRLDALRDRLYLYDKAGGDIVDGCHLGSPKTMQNFWVKVRCKNSSVQRVGSDLILRLWFKPLRYFGGQCGPEAYVCRAIAWDMGGLSIGWQEIGTWGIFCPDE